MTHLAHCLRTASQAGSTGGSTGWGGLEGLDFPRVVTLQSSTKDVARYLTPTESVLQLWFPVITDFGRR